MAVPAILKSMEGVNFNQTGVYILLDFWLLKAFGASAFWLRFPSLIGGAMLFVGAIAFCRVRHFNLFWQISLPLLLLTQDGLIYFLGEARPYMPIAGAVVGLLAYYSAPPEKRRDGIVVLGYCCLVYGAIMHPYFAPYFALIILVTYLDALNFQLRRLSLGSFIRHAEIPAVAVAVGLYFVVGFATWMVRPPKLSFDPFHFIPINQLVPTALGTHFQFLPVHGAWNQSFVLAIIIFAGLLTAYFGGEKGRCALGPLLLLILTIALSTFVSWMSYRSSYWILGRQWIVSTALCCMAIIWLLVSIDNVAIIRWPRAALVISAVVSLYSVDRAAVAIRAQFARLNTWSHDQKNAQTLLALPRIEKMVPDDWVRLANENIRQGGPVWSVFTKYYVRDMP